MTRGSQLIMINYKGGIQEGPKLQGAWRPVPVRLYSLKIVAAFRGMHVSPAKHSFGKCDRKVWQTDRQTDGQTTDKVIPMCRYASQATQKLIKKKKDRNCRWGGRPSPLTPATVHCIPTNTENPKAGIITTFSEFACFAFSFYFFRRNRMETIFIYVCRCWLCKLHLIYPIMCEEMAIFPKNWNSKKEEYLNILQILRRLRKKF